MDPQNYSITLRIRHPSIDPAELSREIGVAPQHAWRAGDPRRLEPGETGGGAYRETYWVGLLPEPQPWAGMLPPAHEAYIGRSGPLAAAMTFSPTATLLLTLARMKRAASFWRTFVDQGGTIECLLQVHVSDNFQLEMSQPLLALLVELKVGLSIELDSGSRAEERAA